MFVSYGYINELIDRRPKLVVCKTEIQKLCDILIECYRGGGKVLVCGNGGSCSDADHIVGELMKGFKYKRELSEKMKNKLRLVSEGFGSELADKLQTPLPAINLCEHAALNTAFGNDVNGEMAFAQQVLGYADKGDVFIGISTSGNARSVAYAAVTAKAKGALLVGFTGKSGGIMHECGLYEVLVQVPESETYRIQEEHIAVYHVVCLAVEEALMKDYLTNEIFTIKAFS